MPKDSTRNTVARQWEMLRALPRNGEGKSTQEICQDLRERGYAVDERTVQRDLAQLEGVMHLQCVGGKPHRWTWPGATELAVTGLPITDALTLSLLKRFIKPLLPAAITSKLEPVFDIAATRLATERRNALARWSELVEVTSTTLQFVPPKVSAEVLQEVQDALFGGEKVKVDYTTSAGKKCDAWVVSPLGLVQAGTLTYLVCRPEPVGKSEILRLPMHRVRAASRMYEPAVKPDRFRLKEYVATAGMEFGTGEEITLELRIRSPHLAQHLASSKLSADQRIEAEASEHHRLHAKVRDTWRLHWWLLSRAEEIEVLGPSSLREEIRLRLERGARIYKE